IAPHAPRAASCGTWLVGASVSPVAVKKNVRNLESGNQAMFSGRLNGVAPAALAAVVATNGVVSPFFDSWMVTHLAGQVVPGVCSLRCAGAVMSPTTSLAWNVTGPPSIVTCSACILPPSSIRRGLFGTWRYTKELGWRAFRKGTLGVPST